MSKYILELIDRDGTYIECINPSLETIDTTMNAFKAEEFDRDELEDLKLWLPDVVSGLFETKLKIVEVL